MAGIQTDHSKHHMAMAETYGLGDQELKPMVVLAMRWA
jgi:hypothetical protein